MTTPDPYGEATLLVTVALDLERALTEAGMAKELRHQIIHDPVFARFAVGKLSEAAGIKQILGNDPINELGINPRTVTALRYEKITSVYDLLSHSRISLEGIRLISPRAVDEIEAVLAARGLSLKK